MGSSNCKSFSPNKSTSSSKNPQKNVTESEKMSSSDEYIEAIVCNDTDVKENEMKSFDIGDGSKVLLVRQDGILSALGSKCTHYGAPLVTGALGKGRVRCPWHGACFNIKTGDIEDYPGLDSLPCYQVTVQEDGQVKVKAKKSHLQSGKRIKNMVKHSLHDKATFVIVGGGPSAAACVETLRQNCFTGRIVMVAKENSLPYDRVKISKALDADIIKLQLRNDNFYSDNSIEVLKGVEVTKLHCANKLVSLSNNCNLTYTSLYIATGSRSRRLALPGSDLENVFTIRTFSDGLAVHTAIGSDVDKHIIILGVSFIGMEAAAYCVGKTKTVTVIGRDNVPFLPVFGEAIGASLMKLFEDKGIQFKMNNNIKLCKGKDGKLIAVELNDGTELAADILLMGVGSEFNTEFLQGSGIEMESNGSVIVNNRMQTNIPGVFAGGDIAKAPVYSHGDMKATIGHFGLAHYHGRIAALNMLCKEAPLKAVPFFWTLVFGKSVRYCGYGRFTDIRIDGDVDNLKFVAYYFDASGKVIAMASCQRDPIVAQFAEYLSQGKTLHRNDLDIDLFGWVKNITSKN